MTHSNTLERVIVICLALVGAYLLTTLSDVSLAEMSGILHFYLKMLAGIAMMLPLFWRISCLFARLRRTTKK